MSQYFPSDRRVQLISIALIWLREGKFKEFREFLDELLNRLREFHGSMEALFHPLMQTRADNEKYIFLWILENSLNFRLATMLEQI